MSKKRAGSKRTTIPADAAPTDAEHACCSVGAGEDRLDPTLPLARAHYWYTPADLDPTPPGPLRKQIAEAASSLLECLPPGMPGRPYERCEGRNYWTCLSGDPCELESLPRWWIEFMADLQALCAACASKGRDDLLQTIHVRYHARFMKAVKELYDCAGEDPRARDEDGGLSVHEGIWFKRVRRSLREVSLLMGPRADDSNSAVLPDSRPAGALSRGQPLQDSAGQDSAASAGGTIPGGPSAPSTKLGRSDVPNSSRDQDVAPLASPKVEDGWYVVFEVEPSEDPQVICRLVQKSELATINSPEGWVLNASRRIRVDGKPTKIEDGQKRKLSKLPVSEYEALRAVFQSIYEDRLPSASITRQHRSHLRRWTKDFLVVRADGERHGVRRNKRVTAIFPKKTSDAS